MTRLNMVWRLSRRALGLLPAAALIVAAWLESDRAAGLATLQAIAADRTPSSTALRHPASRLSFSEDPRLRAERLALVREIESQGVKDPATLAAMRDVPRHEFVPAEHQEHAYGNYPLPIGYGQTISQPYIVAYMTEILRPRPGMKVLEVGTGSGYQAAVLAAIGCEVYTLEIFRALATSAAARLRRLGLTDVRVQHGDGHLGWPAAAPFDAVIVTAAAGYIPPALIKQLKPGGRLVIPVGSIYGVQNLILVEKAASGEVRSRTLLPVQFVPLLRGSR